MSLVPLRARDGSIRANAIIDDADADWLNRWRWSLDRHGYAYRIITRAQADRDGTGRHTAMHRFILGLKTADGLDGDHINGNPLDNRRENLRAVTKAQNQQNRHGGRGSSRYRGVSFHKASGLWVARVMVNGRVHSLRCHHTEDAAAEAVRAFLREHVPHAV